MATGTLLYCMTVDMDKLCAVVRHSFRYNILHIYAIHQPSNKKLLANILNIFAELHMVGH